MKKLITIGVALLCVTSLFAAPKKAAKSTKSSAKTSADTYQGYKAEKDPKTGKIYDFGGMTVYYYDWWTNKDAAPASKQQEDEKAFREWCEKTYNFKVIKTDLAGWDQNPTEVANFCITGSNSKYAVFTIDGRSALSGLKAGLWADLSKVDGIDWTKTKWNKGVLDMLKDGKSFYTFNVGNPEPRNGIFFNKRVLQENGINPEEPYNLQKAGKWTWETFEAMCKKLTKDTNNDGIIDQWAMASSNGQFAESILYSNGVKLISKENGKFRLNVATDNALEAWQYINRVFPTYQRPQMEGESWDYYFAAFLNGEVAFCAEQEYNCMPGNRFNTMKDDYGFVCFPLGPKGGKKYTSVMNDNMMVLPSFYDKATAAKIMKIVDLYTEPVPGYEDEEAWKEAYWAAFRDERAVNETLQYIMDNPYESISGFVPDLNKDVYSWDICAGNDVMETIEKFKNEHQALIDKVN